MEKKLARLERQTQQAIHTLIRMPIFTSHPSRLFKCVILGQRLAAQKGQSDDLVGAMQAASNADDDPPSDDDD
jgi:coiled-coil domain-containing protein 12